MIGKLIAASAALYVGAGFAFSNKLRADALMPRPAKHDFGVWVTGLDGHNITLSAEESRSDMTHPGVIGVYWAGGYGQAGAIVDSDETSVTRAFTNLSNISPPLCRSSEFTFCEPVDLEGWAFQSNPGDVGLEFTEAAFNSPLGSLGAWVVPAVGSTTWVIHVHGLGAARREAVRMLGAYYRSGITSMVIDYRNDPGAPPDPSGHYRFGVTEWEDLHAAVDHARDHGAERLILSGYSTGAAIVMAFAERSQHMEIVEAIVFDSPNIDMDRTVRFVAAKETLPLIPMKVPRSLAAVAMALTDFRWGVDWKAINYLESASRLTVPVLVFHGRADDTVPIDISRALARANPERVQLIEVPEAAHVMSWNADPTLYEEHLERFLAP